MTRLQAARLSKSYGPVRVLHDLDLELAGGEIHALVGENGAGKSTFIKILSGAVVPDAGSVSLDGVALPSGDPLAVRDRGISTVHQEFTLVRDLSVTDNVFLGRERGRFMLRTAEMRREVQALLDSLGVHLDPSAPAGTLSVAHQQMIEIARALSTDARVIILDEPSATLSDVEVDTLFGVLRGLKAQGIAILYVSHRLDEIFALADRVTVLRDGRLVETAPIASWTRQSLIRAMVGRDVAEEYPARHPSFGEAAITLDHLSAPPRFRDVSFSVRAGRDCRPGRPGWRGTDLRRARDHGRDTVTRERSGSGASVGTSHPHPTRSTPAWLM